MDFGSPPTCGEADWIGAQVFLVDADEERGMCWECGIRATPAFVVAKGGITSNDVAVKSLGVRRADVLGQVVAGVPVDPDPDTSGLYECEPIELELRLMNFKRI